MFASFIDNLVGSCCMWFFLLLVGIGALSAFSKKLGASRRKPLLGCNRWTTGARPAGSWRRRWGQVFLSPASRWLWGCGWGITPGTTTATPKRRLLWQFV